MSKKNWSEFDKELDKHLKTVKDTFLDKALYFDDGLIQDKEDDKETEEEKNRRKEELLKLLHEENGELKLIEKVNTILKAKNNRISELKNAFWINKKKLNEEYDDNKEICTESWQTIKGYLDDQEGFIYFLTKAFQNQHIGDMGDLKDIQNDVKKKKKVFCWLFCCKIFLLSLLIIGCICAQLFLYSQLKVCSDQGVDQGYIFLANCILVTAMIVLLVSEVFMVLGIIRLSKKKSYILQRLELILNKMDMHKVSRFEIDRDLEKVLEEMK